MEKRGWTVGLKVGEVCVVDVCENCTEDTEAQRHREKRGDYAAKRGEWITIVPRQFAGIEVRKPFFSFSENRQHG